MRVNLSGAHGRMPKELADFPKAYSRHSQLRGESVSQNVRGKTLDFRGLGHRGKRLPDVKPVAVLSPVLIGCDHIPRACCGRAVFEQDSPQLRVERQASVSRLGLPPVAFLDVYQARLKIVPFPAGIDSFVFAHPRIQALGEKQVCIRAVKLRLLNNRLDLVFGQPIRAALRGGPVQVALRKRRECDVLLGGGCLGLGRKAFFQFRLFLIRLTPVFGLQAAIMPASVLPEFDVIDPVRPPVNRGHSYPRNAKLR